MLPQSILILFAAVFGLCIGSFLNVCIYRLPERLSLMGRSFCPQCHYKVAWYDNFPVISYLILRAKCRHCGIKISLQYPFIELITGGLSVLTLMKSDSLGAYFAWFLLFVAPLITLSIIDIYHRIIPDSISLPGILAGVLVMVFFSSLELKEALIQSGLGILVGGGTLFLLGQLYYILRKREGMGGGDVKLSAMLGAFLGWKGMIFVFLISSILAILYAFVVLLLEKVSGSKSNSEGRVIIPYGPFLSLAALIFHFFGLELTNLYFAFIGLPVNPLFPQ